MARQGGLWKLMRGGWADGSTGFLSLRLQLQVNAELVWGDSCQNLRLANLSHKHYANTARAEFEGDFFFFADNNLSLTISKELGFYYLNSKHTLLFEIFEL